MGLDYVSRFTEPLQRRLLRALETAATGIAPSDITSNGSVGPTFVNTHQSWFVRLVTAAEGLVTRLSGITGVLADGDKGDVIVSAGATVWDIQNGAVTTTKLGGDVTAAGKALLDDADAAAQRTTLGLGTAATQPTGTFVQRVGDTMTGPLVIGGGAVTANAPVLNLTQTWNEGSTTFEGIKLNVTDSASGGSSLLARFQVGGNDRVTFTKSGSGVFNAAVSVGSVLSLTQPTGTIVLYDTTLARGAANTLDLRNSTNAQTWNVYGTADAGLLNYRRIRTTMTTGGAATIAAEGLGGGATGNTLALQVNAVTALSFSAAGTASFSGTVYAGGGSQLAWASRAAMQSPVDGVILLGNYLSTDADFFLKFGVNTSAAAGIKRQGTTLQVRLNDDSARGNLEASALGLTSTFTMGDAANMAFGTTTGTKIGGSTSQKIGFWNATPIVQPSSTGETVGFTAGGGTTVTDASTFTGNVGATAYRISDIVKALKSAGLIAS